MRSLKNIHKRLDEVEVNVKRKFREIVYFADPNKLTLESIGNKYRFKNIEEMKRFISELDHEFVLFWNDIKGGE